MFLSKKDLLLMEENLSLKEEVAALKATCFQQEKQLEQMRNTEKKRAEQEERTAAQFDNLFAYSGASQREVPIEN